MCCRRILWSLALGLFLLLPACGPDEAPEVEVPSWAHVAPEQIAEAKKHGVPVAFENDLGMRFVLIPAGTFLMGSPEGEEGRPTTSDILRDFPELDEISHEVRISRPYYLSIHEATNEQVRAWRPEHDSGEADGLSLDADHQPAVGLSWHDAEGFATWLSDMGSRVYRLPTEAEWEWACRAGTSSPFWFGALDAGPRYMNVLGSMYRDAIARRGADYHAAWLATPDLQDGWEVTCPVGSLPSSPWGLHEVHGNVREWCLDWLGPYPASGTAVDPAGPKAGTARCVRGGSWGGAPYFARSANRVAFVPWSRQDVLGFRLVSPLPEPGEREP